MTDYRAGVKRIVIGGEHVNTSVLNKFTSLMGSRTRVLYNTFGNWSVISRELLCCDSSQAKMAQRLLRRRRRIQVNPIQTRNKTYSYIYTLSREDNKRKLHIAAPLERSSEFCLV